jgi:phage-related protein
MSRITSYYYVSSSGRSPVREFIDSLDAKTQKKFFFVKSLLETFGHKLPEPHAKYIGGGIFELRFKGQEGAIRILYFFFHQGLAIFTNGFIKKTDKTPAQELETARKIREAFLNREKEIR